MVGRPRQFDADVALDTAMRLFWSRGYKATGLSNLIEETGVAKQSLYNTFGHKKTFFLKTLELYRETVAQSFIDRIRAGEPTIDSLRTLLTEWSEGARSAEPFGCFLTNTAAEVGKRDPEISAFLRKSHDMTEAAFVEALESGQQKGEIRADKDAQRLARGLITSANGLMVLSKLDLPEEEYADAIEATLMMLEPC